MRRPSAFSPTARASGPRRSAPPRGICERARHCCCKCRGIPANFGPIHAAEGREESILALAVESPNRGVEETVMRRSPPHADEGWVAWEGLLLLLHKLVLRRLLGKTCWAASRRSPRWPPGRHRMRLVAIIVPSFLSSAKKCWWLVAGPQVVRSMRWWYPGPFDHVSRFRPKHGLDVACNVANGRIACIE